MLTVPVPLPAPARAAYRAIVETGLLARAGALLRPHLSPAGKVFVVTTPTVRRLWGAPLLAGLAAAQISATVLEMPDGERHKSLATLQALAEAMVAAGADRDALVIALGGGVVGDVAAFLASVYMRGVALIQIPTTLVAMVDSSLGGKTAVNLAAGKNLLGTFYHPRAIFVDPATLATLPPREYRSGLAEAIKYGIIADRKLFESIEAHAASLAHADPQALEPLIAACLRQKAAVVVADEREGDLRRVLNFGHTLGHAIESATSYERFLHGESVAWGMIAAGQIALRLGRLHPDEARRMNAAIFAVCRPLPPLDLDPALVLRHAATDKKARAGVLHFVLPTRIGQVAIVNDVPPAVILAALADSAALPR